MESAKREREAAEEGLRQAEERVAGLPEQGEIERTLDDYREREERSAALERAREEEARAREHLEETKRGPRRRRGQAPCRG